MLPHALRALRTHNPSLLVPLPLPIYSAHNKNLRFQRPKSVSTQPENQDNMDKTHDQHQKTQDVMSDSFGEGYATRSDEEGFGGIYGGNQQIRPNTTNKDDQKDNQVVHVNHPDYDKTQGSEVSEKEKGRHQTNIA